VKPTGKLRHESNIGNRSLSSYFNECAVYLWLLTKINPLKRIIANCRHQNKKPNYRWADFNRKYFLSVDSVQYPINLTALFHMLKRIVLHAINKWLVPCQAYGDNLYCGEVITQKLWIVKNSTCQHQISEKIHY